MKPRWTPALVACLLVATAGGAALTSGAALPDIAALPGPALAVHAASPAALAASDVGLTGTGTPPGTAESTEPTEAVDPARDARKARQVIVKLRDGSSARALKPGRPGQGPGSSVRRLDVSRAEVLEVVGGEDPAALAARLAADPRVEYAVPNRRYRFATTDEHYDAQWALHSPSRDVDVDFPEARSRVQGSAAVVVAVIDSGVDINHPDLRSAVWTNEAEAKGRKGVDDDRNGYVDDVHGWDFAGGNASVYDDPTVDEHGTHVAGIIAASADNGVGVAGVAAGVKVLPLKFIGADGVGWADDAIEALAYARRAGARVINLSWGGYDSDPALRDAIAASGALAVAAAGNDGVNVNRRPFYPAAYALPNVLSVTAVDVNGRLPFWANRGARNVDVAAPGVGILSTTPRGRYRSLDGTSMAAPYAAGVAALVASQEPGLRRGQLRTRVTRSAVPQRGLGGVTDTGGLVNAAAAVGAVPVGRLTTSAGLDEVRLRWSNPTDAGFRDVVVRVAEGEDVPAVDGGVLVYEGKGTSALVPGLRPGGTYTVAVYARDDLGLRPATVVRLLGTTLKPSSPSAARRVWRVTLHGPGSRVRLAGRQVELQARSGPDDGWVPICRARTNARGEASCRLAPGERRELQWRFGGAPGYLGALLTLLTASPPPAVPEPPQAPPLVQ